MKRLLVILLSLSVAGCMTTDGTPRVITETPAGITYECMADFGGCKSTPQDVANLAQDHCRKSGKNAQQTQMGTAPSGNFKVSFNCV